MITVKKLFLLLPLIVATAYGQVAPSTSSATPKKVQIIVGSTRQGRSSEKIAKNLELIAKKKGITVEIVDLRDYQLPFLNDEVVPAQRKEITDVAVKKWSDKIQEGTAFIIVCPEYNGGYPGVLKNALDSLYTEWNNKPVGLVVYSGGPSGGASVLAQLSQIADAFKMNVVANSVKIPSSWKAFDSNDAFVDVTIAHQCELMLDQLIAAW
jgi:NAD(P)H-dependent FMN reductase